MKELTLRLETVEGAYIVEGIGPKPPLTYFYEGSLWKLIGVNFTGEFVYHEV
jgi:hypothetical protein